MACKQVACCSVVDSMTEVSLFTLRSTRFPSSHQEAGTKRATSVYMPLPRLQSSQGKFTTSRETEPHTQVLQQARKLRVYVSGTFCCLLDQ